MLKQVFLERAASYAASRKLVQALWQEIELAYTAPTRYHHTLDHLQQMLNELLPLKEQIQDWDTLFFSLCYHDMVYDVTHNIVANDNEEQSAAFAEAALKRISYPAEKIARCKEQILATQKHRLSPDDDTNFLIDADLCILGQPWEVYLAYKNNIRKEYQIYPDRLFYAGRKKMLEHFLRMESIFKTPHFYQLYEEKAKANLRKEYRLLQA
jgi:predicted metal-dependent HD superfamily phosphohydrolase